MSKKQEAKTKAEQAAAMVEELLPSITNSVEAIKGIPVGDHADYQEMCNALFETVELRKTVAEGKDGLLAEEKAVIESVCVAFNPLEAAFKAHEEDMKQRARDYAVECEERYNAMLARAAKLAKSDPKKARELNAKAEDELAPKVKGIAFVGKVEAKVLDLKKVPKEFFKLVLDDAKLKAAAEAKEAVPGVVFEDIRTVRVTPSQREFK